MRRGKDEVEARQAAEAHSSLLRLDVSSLSAQEEELTTVRLESHGAYARHKPSAAPSAAASAAAAALALPVDPTSIDGGEWESYFWELAEFKGGGGGGIHT